MVEAPRPGLASQPMFLTDSELIALLSQKRLVTGIDLGEGPELYSRASQVQPSSVDLRIGEVFIPGTPEGKPGSLGRPSSSAILLPGGTAVVRTLEECNLPSNIGAIGFPPNTISAEGILMTNPGHVDPGFKGRMTFTVINMSEVDFHLLKKDKIVTLLFFWLRQGVARDLGERLADGGEVGVGADSVGKLLGALSPDFLGITAKVKAAAETEEAKTRRSTIKGQVGLALAGIIATIVVVGLGPAEVMRGEISDLKARVESISEAREVRKQVRVNKQVQIRKRRDDRTQVARARRLESP